MEPLINIDTFIEIFNNLNYRRKLDKIILNFFGLDNQIAYENNKVDTNTFLNIIVFINKQYIFTIRVNDTKKILNHSKNFYINFSLEQKNRNYELLYPCYWQFYCYHCIKDNNKKTIEDLAALLAINNLKDILKFLKHQKIFNEEEIKNIINIIKKKCYNSQLKN